MCFRQYQEKYLKPTDETKAKSPGESLGNQFYPEQFANQMVMKWIQLLK